MPFVTAQRRDVTDSKIPEEFQLNSFAETTGEEVIAMDIDKHISVRGLRHNVITSSPTTQ